MELLNIQFAVLLVKLAMCVLPIVLGIAIICTGEEGKREMRNWLCVRLFGVSNAIDYFKFARALLFVGAGMVGCGALASWFLFFSELVQEP